MDPRVAYIKREILTCGSDDWIHVADIAAFAREALYGDHVQDGYPEDDRLSVGALALARDEWLARQEREALPLGIRAVKELLRDGLIRVGDTVGDRFEAWPGSVLEVESRIDIKLGLVTYPVLPGDLFWIENTPAGDEKAALGIDQE
ncbi:hypothetical protein [Actinocatenispora sera]|uniref:Uncharacterized protein n=1 Tax=Actinocatenispora sera TaxID=390989 RepID=A0A810L9Q7_9ACTN|nr:hypothetical protein [Actinocatenispora sera]BCJ32294.1 hypothetical protein Asera_64020 [Actinocatenispora sera]